jgi:glycosyltransferase involved in cell wall biosynthesis
MIVRNEEEYLPGCLESIRGLVDEIVIVDTGSTDRTVEIASSHRAKVHFFSWVNDFSAARNESLRHATGNWILYLDADERLNCLGEADCIRKTVMEGGADAYSVPIRSHKTDDEAVNFRITYNLRLFRRYPGIEFSGEVHERVEPFLEAVHARMGRASFFVEHLGYDLDQSGLEQKLQRNLTLSYKQLERNPDDSYALYYLGFGLKVLGRDEESLEALKKALQAKGATPLFRPLILNLIAHIHLSRNDYLAVTRAARESLNLIPRQNTARLLLGLAYFHERRFEEALPFLLQACQFLGLPAEKRYTEISQEFSIDRDEILKAIGVCHGTCGRYAEAIPFLIRYAKGHPKDWESLKFAGICYLNCGDTASALHYLGKAHALDSTSEYVQLILACAHLRSGQIPLALEYFGRAHPKSAEEIEATVKVLELMAREPACMENFHALIRSKGPVLMDAPFQSRKSLFMALLDSRRLDAMIELFRWVKPLERASFFQILIDYCSQRQSLPDACLVFQQILREIPGDKAALDSLGIAYIKCGDYLRAIETYKKLEILTAGNPEVSRKLAGLFVKMGNFEAAAAYVERSRRS